MNTYKRHICSKKKIPIFKKIFVSRYSTVQCSQRILSSVSLCLNRLKMPRKNSAKVSWHVISYRILSGVWSNSFVVWINSILHSARLWGPTEIWSFRNHSTLEHNLSKKNLVLSIFMLSFNQNNHQQHSITIYINISSAPRRLWIFTSWAPATTLPLPPSPSGGA